MKKLDQSDKDLVDTSDKSQVHHGFARVAGNVGLHLPTNWNNAIELNLQWRI